MLVRVVPQLDTYRAHIRRQINFERRYISRRHFLNGRAEQRLVFDDMLAQLFCIMIGYDVVLHSVGGRIDGALHVVFDVVFFAYRLEKGGIEELVGLNPV